MLFFDFLTAFNIRYRARNLKYSVIGAGGKSQLVKTAVQAVRSIVGHDTEFTKQSGGEAGVAGNARAGVAAVLNFAGTVDTFSDLRGRFRFRAVIERFVINRRNFDV